MGNSIKWIYLVVLLVCSAAQAQTPGTAALAPSAPAQTKSAAAPNPAGTINLVVGDARIVSAGARPRAAKTGDVVSEGDSLVTGTDGEVHMTMQDSGFIALRPNTRFRVASYKADGGANDKAIFRLLAGGFRSVTGWIGTFNRGAYRVGTPTATIGVRGTDHEPRYIPEGSTEGEPGTYDKVYAGATYIENPAGRAVVAPNQAGFVPFRGRERPRLLARIPGFFRASRNEAIIETKHAEIQQMIAQRRDERRKVIAEKRAALDAAQAQARALQEQNKAAAEERRKAIQEQRKEAQRKRETLQKENKATQELNKDVQQKRKALQEEEKAGRAPGRELREKRKPLREENKAMLEQRNETQQKRNALQEENKAAAEKRGKAAQDQRKATEEQRKDVQTKRKTLEEEREATQEDLKTLREQERERYREELKAARKKRAAPNGARNDEKTP
jgi:FecR protein